MRKANMSKINKQTRTLSREYKTINKMSNEHIINQMNTVESDQNNEGHNNIKRIKNINKMNTKHIKETIITVESDTTNKIDDSDDLLSYYKPSRNYDNGPDYKIPSNFTSKNGKFDTSKKYWGLKNNKWTTNRKYERPATTKIKSNYNLRGKHQGDNIKYKPRELPKQVFVKHELKVIDEDIVENKFWADFDDIPDNDLSFLKGTECLYKQFLKDGIDTEFDDILNEFDNKTIVDDEDFRADMETETFMETEVTNIQINNDDDLNLNGNFDTDYRRELIPNNILDEIYALLENSDEDNILRDLLNGERTTQGWAIPLTYISEAVTTIASTVGIYYGYQTLRDLCFSVETVKSGGLFSHIKEYFIDLLVVLISFAKYYQDKLTLTETIAILTAYYATKQYLTGKLDNIIETIKMLSPAQSNFRRAQGVDPTTFAQGVISIIGAFFLGNALVDFNAHNILTSVKSLGSTLLTVKTFEGIIISIIQMLPDIIMAIICQTFPIVGMYIHITTNAEFKRFMDKTIKLHNMGILNILYNSHHLASFLELHNQLINQVLTTENMDRGMAQIIDKYIKWYDLAYKVADKLGLLPGKRQMPYVIWLSGTPGIGKSTFAKQLATKFVKTFFETTGGEEISKINVSKYIYSHSTANKYFDGYNNQPVFILNDYLQFTTAEEEQWLIKFVDTIDLPLEVASVDNVEQGIKGEVRFTSRIIIVTSNSTYLSTSQNIIDVDALNRRRDLLVKMEYKDEQDIDFNNFNFDWVNFNLLQPLARDAVKPAYKVIGCLDQFVENMMNHYISFLSRSDMVLEATSMSDYNENFVSDHVQDYENMKKGWTTILDTITEMASKFLNTTLFYIGKYAVQLNALISICTVGTLGYYGYKAYTETLISKAQSMSGDVSTHKYKQDRTPLKRYTMGISSNVQDLCLVIRKNMCEITTIIKTVDGRLISQTMWGFFTGGSLLVTPKHLWKRGHACVLPGDSITIVSKGVTYSFTYNNNDLHIDEDRDIACYNTCGRMPMVKSVEHLLMDETTQVDTQENQGFLIIAAKDNTITHNVTAFIRDAPYVDAFGGSFSGKEIWQYNIKTLQGDCGSILLISSGGKLNIGGIHVAGDSYSGNSEILDKIFIEEAKLHFGRVTQGFATDAILEDEEFFDAVSDLDEGFIFLGKTIKAPFQNGNTSIIRGPFFEVLQPHITEPAVLRPSDERMEGVISPMLKSVKKFGEYITPFDEASMSRAFNIVKTFYDPMMIDEFKVYDHNEAINSTHTQYLEKLDIKTSAGYPWSTMRKSKKNLITSDNGKLTIGKELQTKLDTCENLLRRKTMFPYTLTTTLKDERVAKEKVKIGKTRTFMNFPVEYTILMRKYFDGFINSETKNASVLGTTVGVNIYSSKWDALFLELKKFDYHLDGDYKSFDGTIRPEFFRYYTRLVNMFYKDEYSNTRALLVQGCCFAPIFVLDKVYMKLKGNPSGSRITTSFNSFVNRMYVVMSMLHKLPEVYHTSEFFKTNLKLYVHGDDHLMGFSQLLRNYWTGLDLQDYMIVHGITYTSSKKDQPLVPYCKLEECYYLKSHFVYCKETNTIKCGLDKTVIQEMVSWQRDDSLNSTMMILNTCLRYAYFWGEDYFNDIRGKLINHMSIIKTFIPLPYYEDLENEYRYQGQLEFNYTKF